jgi:hypothetical protein
VTPRWYRDLDQNGAGRDEAPKPSGRAVTEKRSSSTCEDRRKAASVRGEPRMSNGVDATVNRVEPPNARLARDCVSGVAQLLKLASGHYAVLPAGQRGPGLVRSQFVPHTETKCERTMFSPPSLPVRTGSVRSLSRIPRQSANALSFSPNPSRHSPPE